MELFSLKDTKSEGEYFVEVMTRINDLKKKITPEGSLFEVFHDFWKLGCSLKALRGEEATKIFLEIKKRRNNSLKKEKNLRSFLVSEKDFEVDGVYRNTASKNMASLVFSFMDDCEDNISMELKKGIGDSDIKKAIKEFYEAKGYAVELGFSINIKNTETGKIAKIITLTVIPEMFTRNSVAMISINNYE